MSGDTEPVEILAAAMRRPLWQARQLMRELELRGYTVYRKRVQRNARRPDSSTPMSPQLRAAIRMTYVQHPDMTQAEIAARFRVNPGRVAEALKEITDD